MLGQHMWPFPLHTEWSGQQPLFGSKGKAFRLNMRIGSSKCVTSFSTLRLLSSCRNEQGTGKRGCLEIL